ncbi:VOC family protein [Kitasatospora sp. NPDC096147]|uniref:VOC family protein n=1 Tax=Kitasatospora sp. NPDC096147 TaxID=3364093 RepID=UPI00382526C6
MTVSATMITIDCSDPGALARWWATVLDAEITEDFGEFVMVGAKPLTLGFQLVPEPKLSKNRVHLDLKADDLTAEVRRLVDLGATVVGEQQAPGLVWTVLQDPAGNEFCVSHGH